MGTGLPFRPATFDACVSISALQWLCYSNAKGQIPKKRLTRFFSSLYQVLRRGARAVLQFYPGGSFSFFDISCLPDWKHYWMKEC
jgi:18S rRNA (guanine1575-N7)-methyltransferase